MIPVIFGIPAIVGGIVFLLSGCTSKKDHEPPPTEGEDNYIDRVIFTNTDTATNESNDGGSACRIGDQLEIDATFKEGKKPEGATYKLELGGITLVSSSTLPLKLDTSTLTEGDKNPTFIADLPETNNDLESTTWLSSYYCHQSPEITSIDYGEIDPDHDGKINPLEEVKLKVDPYVDQKRDSNDLENFVINWIIDGKDLGDMGTEFPYQWNSTGEKKVEVEIYSKLDPNKTKACDTSTWKPWVVAYKEPDVKITNKTNNEVQSNGITCRIGDKLSIEPKFDENLPEGTLYSLIYLDKNGNKQTLSSTSSILEEDGTTKVMFELDTANVMEGSQKITFMADLPNVDFSDDVVKDDIGLSAYYCHQSPTIGSIVPEIVNDDGNGKINAGETIRFIANGTAQRDENGDDIIDDNDLNVPIYKWYINGQLIDDQNRSITYIFTEAGPINVKVIEVLGGEECDSVERSDLYADPEDLGEAVVSLSGPTTAQFYETIRVTATLDQPDEEVYFEWKYLAEAAEIMKNRTETGEELYLVISNISEGVDQVSGDIEVIAKKQDVELSRAKLTLYAQKCLNYGDYSLALTKIEETPDNQVEIGEEVTFTAIPPEEIAESIEKYTWYLNNIEQEDESGKSFSYTFNEAMPYIIDVEAKIKDSDCKIKYPNNLTVYVGVPEIKGKVLASSSGKVGEAINFTLSGLEEGYNFTLSFGDGGTVKNIQEDTSINHTYFDDNPYEAILFAQKLDETGNPTGEIYEIWKQIIYISELSLNVIGSHIAYVGEEESYAISNPVEGITYQWIPPDSSEPVYGTSASFIFNSELSGDITVLALNAEEEKVGQATHDIKVYQEDIPIPRPSLIIPDYIYTGQVLTASVSDPKAGYTYVWVIPDPNDSDGDGEKTEIVTQDPELEEIKIGWMAPEETGRYAFEIYVYDKNDLEKPPVYESRSVEVVSYPVPIIQIIVNNLGPQDTNGDWENDAMKVFFDASGTYVVDKNGNKIDNDNGQLDYRLLLSWDFGDNSPPSEGYFNNYATVEKIFQSPSGSHHTVRLKVTDVETGSYNEVAIPIDVWY